MLLIVRQISGSCFYEIVAIKSAFTDKQDNLISRKAFEIYGVLWIGISIVVVFVFVPGTKNRPLIFARLDSFCHALEL